MLFRSTGSSLLQTDSKVLSSTYATDPPLTTTTTFYVTFSNACGESSPRTPVVATINGLEPTSIPGSSCGGVTVAPRAFNATGGIFNWYDMETGGTAFRTSPKVQFDSFTPDPLPNVTTDYYVSITNDVTGCESARTSVRFSINGDPAIVPTVTPAESCGPEIGRAHV